jgi:EmrB/QacA subfamily drug resistance transporter
VARRWKVLLVTSVAVFMALLDVTIVNIAFPDIRRSFPGGSLADLSWVLNAYNVVFAAALVPAGRLADRLGRRRLFLVGVLVFLGASLVCGLAGNPELLVAARAVQALGAAVLVPTSLSLALPEFPPARRATATALWTATGAVAAATGPSLGGLLVDWQSWRWVFFVNLVIGLPALIPAWRLLRESRDEATTRWPDLRGAALLAGAVAALALALVQGDDWGWRSGRIVGSLAASAVLLVAFVASSARHPVPVVEFGLLRVRSFGIANLASILFGVGFFAILLCNVLFLTDVWRYGILLAGVALTPGPVAAALTAPLAGRLTDRFGPRAVAMPGGLLFAAGALLLAATTGARENYLADFLPSAVLIGSGVGLCLPALGGAAVAELPRARFATGVAISALSRQLGAVVGIAGLVAILGTAGPTTAIATFHRAYLFVAATGLLTAVAVLALGRVRARDVAEVRV